MTVSEQIVAQLAAAGVRRAYTVPGESFLPLLDACDRHPDIALISTRHESGAAFMADADAKVTGSAGARDGDARRRRREPRDRRAHRHARTRRR